MKSLSDSPAKANFFNAFSFFDYSDTDLILIARFFETLRLRDSNPGPLSEKPITITPRPPPQPRLCAVRSVTLSVPKDSNLFHIVELAFSYLGQVHSAIDDCSGQRYTLGQ